MASRSFSNAKVLSGLVARAVTGGRGFASAAPQRAASGATQGGPKMVKKESGGAKQKTAWVPDPRTGCYRPENVVEEIDVAELRAALLKKH